LLDILYTATRNEEQSHIVLVPFVAAWMLWLRRSRLRCVRVQPSLIGPIIVLAGWLLSWSGFMQGMLVAEHAGALLVLIGILLSFTGLAPLREFGPVFVLLLFAIPVPGQLREVIAVPLQSLASTVTFGTLEVFGVPVSRFGNVLEINGEQIAVAEACNGMRMVFALALVVYAFAFSTPLRTSTRIVLLGLSPITALLCNVIRLIPTSLVYGYGSSSNAESFHDIAGWIMLPIALVLLIKVVRLMKWLEFPVTQFRLARQ